MTGEGDHLSIAPLTEEQLQAVLRIHLAEMGYTLNSELGWDHLRLLYQRMAGDPSCYVGVAMMGEEAVGAVSGALDADAFVERLLRSMPARQLAQMAARMLLRPRLIYKWLQGSIIARPASVMESEIRAVLTAIVVDARAQGRGAGRLLVGAFEGFLREHGILSYRLDTQISNDGAASFYRKLGFQEVARRAGSIVFVRRLTP